MKIFSRMLYIVLGQQWTSSTMAGGCQWSSRSRTILERIAAGSGPVIAGNASGTSTNKEVWIASILGNWGGGGVEFRIPHTKGHRGAAQKWMPRNAELSAYAKTIKHNSTPSNLEPHSIPNSTNPNFPWKHKFPTSCSLPTPPLLHSSPYLPNRNETILPRSSEKFSWDMKVGRWMLKAGWWLFYGRVLVRDEGREGGWGGRWWRRIEEVRR